MIDQHRTNHCVLLFATLFIQLVSCIPLSAQTDDAVPEKADGSLRIATFNVAMNRRGEGQLLKELEKGSSDKVSKVAAIIQTVRPDVLLINEIDFDGGQTVDAFKRQFLAKSQHGQQPIEYPYQFVQTVNTGVDSGMDLNGDKRVGSPNDAYGFGFFPGQYGMAVLSMHPIKEAEIRTFQNFLWKDMPGALLPTHPDSGKAWYTDKALDVFRLSSKSHWDVPIEVESQTFHFLVCHPTPPVFDGAEDANGKRNHDEIRIWADYVADECPWLYDDAGNKGGLKPGTPFVIAGDLNADPKDGDSAVNAIGQLLNHDLIHATPIPSSNGGKYYSDKDGKINLKHKGDPMHDTANFKDDVAGNVRVDYVLPSKGFEITNTGVFWPAPGESGNDLSNASDHRMVWIDVELPKK